MPALKTTHTDEPSASSAWKSPRTIPNIVRRILARVQNGADGERLVIAQFSRSENCWHDQADDSRTPVHLIAWYPIPSFEPSGEMSDKFFEDVIAELDMPRHFRNVLVSAEISAAWDSGERSASRIAAQVLKSWHLKKILGAAR
jgi:hypothetical protein